MTIALARTCDGCGAELPAAARRDRRYCSGKCRSAAHRRRQRVAEPVLVTPNEPEDEFEHALERALREERLVARVASAGHWRAAAWLLERRYPERWAPGASESTRAHAVARDDPFAEVDELRRRRQRRRSER